MKRSKHIEAIIDKHAPGREVLAVITGTNAPETKQSNINRWMRRHGYTLTDLYNGIIDIVEGPRAGTSRRDGVYMIVCRGKEKTQEEREGALLELCGVCKNWRECYGIRA